MILIGMLWLIFFGNAQESSSTLDQMEYVSTDIKERSARLRRLFTIPTEESIPMLEIESSMMEMENLVMQLENHISTLPPSL